MTSLKECNLKIGAKVIIELSAPKRKVALQLLGVIEGKSLMLSAPKLKSSYAANKVEGSSANIHIMLPASIVTFVSQVTHVISTPFPYWHIAYPKKIDVSHMHKYESVSIHLPVAIQARDKVLSQHVEIPNIVLCTRLSQCAVVIESPVSLADFGEEYFITLRINISDVDQMLATPVILKSSKEAEPGVFIHQLEFQALADESKVLIAAFLYKKILVEYGYVND